MDSNTVAIVSVSVTGVLALAQLLTTWRLAVRTQVHQTELATIESNRDDVKNAHAGLYRKLASYLRASAIPAGAHPYPQSGPEQWETWQAFDEPLSEVWLMASPEAARLGEAAVGAVADLAEYGADEGEAAIASYQRAEKAIADYRAAIRRDRGLEQAQTT